MEILDRNQWRLSRSGFSIRTGWGDEKIMIASYSGSATKLDAAEYQSWLDNAEHICDLHNGTLNA